VLDTRCWGPGERIVFEPWTKGMFEATYRWVAERGIFPERQMGSAAYEGAILSLGA
jgi:hypothetical protein